MKRSPRSRNEISEISETDRKMLHVATAWHRALLVALACAIALSRLLSLPTWVFEVQGSLHCWLPCYRLKGLNRRRVR